MDREIVLQTQLKLSLQRIRQQIADLELMDIRSKRSQELFTALFISSPIGIFIVQGGKFVNVNPQFENLIGISKGDLIGRESLSLVLAEDREIVAVNAKKMLKGEATEPYEYRVIQEDGSIKWIMETVTSIQYMGSTATLGNFMDITSRKQTEAALLDSQEHYRDLFENANDIIYVHDLKGRFVSLNKRALEISGYQLEEVINRSFIDVIAPPYHVLVSHTMVRDIFLGLTPTYELEMITKSGKLVPMEVRPRLLKKNGVPYGVQGIARDITERKHMETELRATNQRLLDIIEFLPDATFVIDNLGKVIAWNRAIETMTGVNKNAIIGKGDYLYAIPFYGTSRPMLADLIGNLSVDHTDYYEEVHQEGNSLYTEIFAPGMYGANGAFIWVKASPLMDADGKIVGAIESIRDISERKHFEEQLRYLSMHDGLTNLYNRTYFEEEISRLEAGRFQPTGLLICDVDGLKLVNDTLGHDVGDNLLISVARVLQSCFRGEDVVARVGGDEFAILMPRSDEAVTEIACMRIREAVNMYNAQNPEIPLSLSLGFSVRSTPDTTMIEVYQAADNNMYREKLHRRQSARSAIVNTLMKALQERDFITEGHADRLQDMVAILGEAIGLPGHRISDLRLFAEFHDIGKVGIPDRILFKPGPLSKDEVFEMQRHSEIGHRIALSAPDLVPIADWILKHHEWWNGHGYPMGLREGEIPLECRILSIADAYDAMTSDRPYRTAMPRRLALEELEKHAGTQFDPSLVQAFARIVRNDEHVE